MYGETNLGATDEAVIMYLKTPMNKAILDALKRHVYPEFAVQFGTPKADIKVDESSEPVNIEETDVEEPPVNPGNKGRKNTK